MQIELKVPAVGESITEVEIGQWLKNEGDAVAMNDNLVVIESEKTTLELPAPAAGALKKILKRKGEIAKVGEVIGFLEQNGAPTAKAESTPATQPASTATSSGHTEHRVMPAAARVMAEQGIQAENIQGSGPGGRVLKDDVLKQVEGLQKEKAPAPTQPAPPASAPAPAQKPAAIADVSAGSRQEQVVPMTRLRKTLAERLVH